MGSAGLRGRGQSLNSSRTEYAAVCHRLVVLVIAATLTSCAKPARMDDDFSRGFGRWEPLDAANWKVYRREGNAFLVLVKPGAQRPPVRRPGEYALFGDQSWSDVTIEVRARTLRPETVVHRDVCVIFGYRDDTHFYYAHISSASDGSVHNVIMKVSGRTRERINREPRPDPRLTDGWHTIRVRHLRTGRIEVWVDSFEKPVMSAFDRDYQSGRVGVGSFDDPAAFDDFHVAGRASSS